MSWIDGVDLFAAEGEAMTIFHVARAVATPRGTAASGMVLIPRPEGPLMGFVSEDPEVGAYFGPHVFAGTPFENAPVLAATITVSTEPDAVEATVVVEGATLRCRLSGLGAAETVRREPGGATPFVQTGLERVAARAEMWLDGEPLPLSVPPVGMTGGPAAVHSPGGAYTR